MPHSKAIDNQKENILNIKMLTIQTETVLTVPYNMSPCCHHLFEPTSYKIAFQWQDFWHSCAIAINNIKGILAKMILPYLAEENTAWTNLHHDFHQLHNHHESSNDNSLCLFCLPLSVQFTHNSAPLPITCPTLHDCVCLGSVLDPRQGSQVSKRVLRRSLALWPCTVDLSAPFPFS